MKLILVILLCVHYVTSNKVQQVHLSLSGNLDEMVVTWLTQHPLPNVTPFVSYGLVSNDLRYTSKATTTKWIDQGSKAKTRYTYRATMKNMIAGTKYYYSVGSSEASSEIFYFTQPDPSKHLRVAIYGDLSLKNGYSIDPLINATHSGDFDLVIHIGDLAYDLHDKNGDKGDDFMNAIEPITAYIPYMVFAGNHETDANFNHIANRFTMPTNGVYDNNLFWSFDYGITHFVAFNTEYYALNMSKEAIAQYDWLKEDLQKNNNRWTIALFHRPMYCSDISNEGCNDPADTITIDGNSDFPGLEKLLKDSNVDMIMYGHKHTYERMWPMYQGVPIKSDNPNYIQNPGAPVFMLTGAAGCHSHTGPSDSIPQSYSITRLANYGYTLLNVYNSTHIGTTFVDTSVNVGMHLDDFILEKN